MSFGHVQKPRHHLCSTGQFDTGSALGIRSDPTIGNWCFFSLALIRFIPYLIFSPVQTFPSIGFSSPGLNVVCHCLCRRRPKGFWPQLKCFFLVSPFPVFPSAIDLVLPSTFADNSQSVFGSSSTSLSDGFFNWRPSPRDGIPRKEYPSTRLRCILAPKLGSLAREFSHAR